MKINGSLKWIAFGILLVFMLTACSSSVFSTGRTTDEILVDDIQFFCYNSGNTKKTQYYIQALQSLEETPSMPDETQYTLNTEYSVRDTEKPSFYETTDPKDTPWPMKCHDNRHTGRSPYSTMDNNGAELWKFKSKWIEGGPVIDSVGTIYFGDNWGNFYALLQDGALKWRFDNAKGRITSVPTLAEDGTIYVGSWDCNLYAIYPNGTLKWEAGTAGSISSSPAIARDGTIYIGTMKGFDKGDIIAVNSDGTEKWRYTTDYYITSDPAVDEDGTIYIGSGDTYFYAMNPDGTLKWRFKTGHYIKGPPSIAADGTIYVGSYDGYLYALHPDGSLKWKYKLKYGTETNPSIGPDGTIYVGDDKLYAINPDGTFKWAFNLGSNQDIFQSSPAVSADGIIYVGTNIGETDGGDIIAVNPDGTERWRHRISDSGWVDSLPCIDENGIVYIGSSLANDTGFYGYLYAFGPGEGNNPPNTPTIDGPSGGKTGEEYSYSISTTDPDDDNIFY